MNNVISLQKAKKLLVQGRIGVLPTDTIYGIVGKAFSKKAVRRIYTVRKRNSKKPCIILIGSFHDLELFDIRPDASMEKLLRNVWPGFSSVILPCPLKKFAYLHRGAQTLAFRLPKKRSLIQLLKKTGPLVAPSANPEGEKPASTIQEARKYFGEKMDFYISGGRINKKPSALFLLKNGKFIVKRKGHTNVPKSVNS